MNPVDPAERLATDLSTARIAHESIFELHRRLTGLRSTERPSELLREAARIVSSDLPAAVAQARQLLARWQDQSVLDPEGAQKTLHELAVELDAVEPQVAKLLTRQRQIARELRSLLEEASG